MPLMMKTLHLWFLRDIRDLRKPHSDRRKRDHQHGKIQMLYWNKRCQRTRASEQMSPRFWAKRQKVKPSETFINKFSDERNLRDFHLKHYHMSAAQFKKKKTHLDIPGNFKNYYQHVVKTCPFCNSIKPRPERSHVSGLRAEEFGDLIFRRQNLWILDCIGWCYISFDSISMSEYFSIRSNFQTS